jgi:hypothetical protein
MCKIRCIGLICLAFFSFLCCSAAAQSIDLTFLKDTVEQNGNTYSFNTVILRNTSAVVRKFTIEAQAPEGWQLLFDNRKVFELGPNQTLSLPLRLAAAIQTEATIYSVRLFLNVAGYSQKSAYAYYARVGANSKWRVSLLNPNLLLSRASRENSFRLLLSNKGNATEELNIHINTSLMLLQGRNSSVKLAAGKDTTLVYSFSVAVKFLDNFKSQEVMVQVTDQKKQNQLLLQRISSFGTVFRENPSGWYTFPLSIEFVAQNFTTAQKALYINSNGSLDLDKGRSLNFNYRTDNFNAQSDGSSRYAFLNYNSPKWKVSVGDQSEFGDFLIDGLGVRLGFDNGKGYRTEVLGVDSRLGDAKLFRLNQQLNFLGNQQLENQTMASFDRENKINSVLNMSTYELGWRKYSHLILRAGISREEFYRFSEPLRKTGSTLAAAYSYSSPRLTGRFGLSATDANFPGMNRGLRQSNNELTFHFKQLSLGLLFDYNERQLNPALDTGTVLRQLLGGRIAEYGLKTGWRFDKGYVTLISSVINQVQSSSDLLLIRSYKLNFNAGKEFSHNLSASFSGNLLRNLAPDDPSAKAGYSLNAYATLAARNYGFFVRLDNGPSYYFDFVNYLNNGYSTRRLQFSPYYEQSFFKEVLHFRVQMDYTDDRSLPVPEFMARGDLSLDLNSKGLSFRIFGSKNVRTIYGNRSDYMSMSIRKSFNLPLLGIKRFVTMKVLLFKDFNSNGIYDLGDEAIPDATLGIAAQHFLSNKKGEVSYKNIKAGEYDVDLSRVNAVKGWMPRNGFRQHYEVHSSQTVYIPFSQSHYLSGKLNVQKDPRSNLVFRPDNIRINVTNSRGESFSTLTTESGEFFINLPQDTYKVRISSGVFDEDFRLLSDTFNADLLHKNSEHLIFEVRERKRQINIRKQY